MLIEELERRLLWFREEASEEEFDAEEVDAICTMLSKLSPENKPHRTKEETYQNILKQVSLEEELSQEKNAEKTEGKGPTARRALLLPGGWGFGRLPFFLWQPVRWYP